MKRMFAMLLALCMILCLCACGGEKTPETTGATEGTTTAPVADTTEATNNDEPQIPEGMIVYTVKVADEGGNPIVGAMVQMCQGESCLPGATGDDGVASFTVNEAEYKVSFLALPAGYELTTEEAEFYFDGDATEMTITLKAVA